MHLKMAGALHLLGSVCVRLSGQLMFSGKLCCFRPRAFASGSRA